MARIKKYKKHLIALAALVLALVCLFKPEYAENVARAFMLLIAGDTLGGDFCDGCRPLLCLLRGRAGSRPE